MTSRATYLRLSPLTNRWTRTTRPFNLSKHARPLPAPPARTKGVKEPFETLVADLTPVPGVQVPRLEAGAREGVPRAGMAVEGDGQAMPVGAGEGEKVKAEQSTTKGKAWMGVEIPLKPAAPEEGECCMSGCAVCVYDLYLSDLEHFQLSLASARKAIMARLDALPPHEKEQKMKEWPDELGDKPGEGVVGKEGGVDAKKEAEKELERERKTLDPTVRAFLEMEARVKAKGKDR
ncbi:hypothetical protein NBRC10512_004161 [Rhodotorula toruloides]|uniref:RHTO0S01e00364g1_1 n=2 Tax=Rhodotorula toruloides TaxID=5286 RepID=A0A061ADA2_RHOTO|nr:oxidoreductase-like domain containing protein [Rhodotorula toruloides NP11]EMS18106.1 oxidoreductase-like domain containing protein [Rhodotorula toruloides NP11]CDR35488.1 RHTO0S01e00364g1_1 [Rhodotorula toruloides]